MVDDMKNETASMTMWDRILDWSLGGVDFSVAGNGGLECRDHVSFQRRVLETFIGMGVPFILCMLFKTSSSIEEDNMEKRRYNIRNPNHYSLLRMGLLVALAFTFGIEVGYKLASRQLIWLFNPCHVTSLVQIYLLALPSSSSFQQGLYRSSLHFLHGPIAAMIFPVTEPLVLPFEKEIYWIQHVLIVLVPAYFIMINDGHGYVPHRPWDMAGLARAFLLWSFWHWIVLQWLSYFTWANVGSMLCAATSDPFSGPNYRLMGIGHQLVAIAIFGSLTALLGDRGGTWRRDGLKNE